MKGMRFFCRLLLCLFCALWVGACAGQSVVWHGRLDDAESIASDGGEIVNGPASFVAGVEGNAFAGNGSAYVSWDDGDVGDIFAGWDNDSGVTVDLYFRGNHWNSHSGHSGLWSIVRRGSDRYIILSVYNGKMRHMFRDAGGEFKYRITGVTLINNVTYRLTIRQADGVFEVYLGGGGHSNDFPVFSAGDLPSGHTWDFVPSGGSSAREMNVGRRAIFDGVLQSGEWVDNVRVYNGFYTPEEIDSSSECPAGDVNDDCIVSVGDLEVISDNWLGEGLSRGEGNIFEDEIVDLCDFALMAQEWLIGAAVTIISEPSDVEIYGGGSAGFHVIANGPEPILYQWRKDGVDLEDGGDISGAQAARLEIANVDGSDEGSYRSVVKNDYSEAVSKAATLTVVGLGDLGISASGHYATYKGEVLMLVGDSGTLCAAQNSNLDHREWIDDCAMRGIRAVHIWSFVPARQKQDGSQIEDRWGYVIPDVMPWARKTSGPLALDQRYQWDLKSFDEGGEGDLTHYWSRLRDMCSYAKSKNVLVGITMFSGWSKHDYSWIFHPLNINNGGHLTNNGDAVIIGSPGVEVWQEPWSDGWSNAKKTQWVWENLSVKFIEEVGSMGNVFFVFFDEHSYSEGNMGDHFMDFFKRRGQIWMDWSSRRSGVAWVMSGTLHSTDKNSNAVSGFSGYPARPYFNLEGAPYMGDEVRTAIWTFSIGGGSFIFHADERQETVRTGIMGYDPQVPDGDKGMYKRDWLGHAGTFFNQHVDDLDSLVPANGLSSSPGTYCLADNGAEYAVYSRIGSSAGFSLNLSAAAGKTLNCRFYNPRTGVFNVTFQRPGGDSAESFTKPDSDDWVLHIVEN